MISECYPPEHLTLVPPASMSAALEDYCCSFLSVVTWPAFSNAIWHEFLFYFENKFLKCYTSGADEDGDLGRSSLALTYLGQTPPDCNLKMSIRCLTSSNKFLFQGSYLDCKVEAFVGLVKFGVLWAAGNFSSVVFNFLDMLHIL